MAGFKDIRKNPLTFNSDYTRDVRSATKGFKLSPDQFNAAKHAGVSAVLTDVVGKDAANLFGHGVEKLQDLRGLFNPNNVGDDFKDLTNNAIGREYARRNPGKTAEQYYRAMAALAQSGNLVEDPDFNRPVPTGRHHAEEFHNYIENLVSKALDPDTTGLFSKPLEAKNPNDLNGPEGKVYSLPRSRSPASGDMFKDQRFGIEPVGESSPNGRRTQLQPDALERVNPFDFKTPDLPQQAAVLERNPVLAERMILAAGRDPELFGLSRSSRFA